MSACPAIFEPRFWVLLLLSLADQPGRETRRANRYRVCTHQAQDAFHWLAGELLDVNGREPKIHVWVAQKGSGLLHPQGAVVVERGRSGPPVQRNQGRLGRRTLDEVLRITCWALRHRLDPPTRAPAGRPLRRGRLDIMARYSISTFALFQGPKHLITESENERRDLAP